ncbi:benzoate/H(+) symporter BenE family transporter [Nocardioides sp. R-C-SC26]|uniref:benzoate/H(+) symporter BenE family transporter n=1 Tax=Nocardioides sp. R-C-SC26 TaxID=2870414 RepID=UPI001E5CB56D|nr:benzoate/H(+) symporter BenE family transporter [Nocardioides sp. R-C-SC26]
MSGPRRRASRAQPIIAGVITAVVGFTSSFAVVLTGLAAMGASPDEASSGLLVLSVTMGIGCVLLSWTTRTPVTMAWSTPGAALLAGATIPDGGYADAVGAFVVAGLLYLLTAAVRPLGDAVRAIPAPLANAMLAGVLLTLCVAPFRALADDPAVIAPVLATWLVMQRLARRWAVPAAFAVALVVIALDGALGSLDAGMLTPSLTWTSPTFDPLTMVAIGVPLYLVTMTSQNIPGVAVLGSFGYQAPLRPALGVAGVATVLTAPAGGFSINLAAISAALAAGPTADEDPRRRWIAGVSTGVSYLVLGLTAAAITAVAATSSGVITAVAGLALLGTFASAATSALAEERSREPAALTLVVAASGLTLAGIGAAFWALVAGGLLMGVMRIASPRDRRHRL